jgi:predicted DCC family thiol-disulfide oxidoreductase YuxK
MRATAMVLMGATGGWARGLVGPAAGLMPANFQLPRGRSVILFDGVCNFCNRWVQFVIDNDPDASFSFSSMQSPAGRQLLKACGRPSDDLSTFVLIDDAGAA